MSALSTHFARVQRYLDRPWYPLLLGALAAADQILVVIPTDGLTVAAILATPRRWMQYAIAATTGNLLGCGILAEGIYRNSDWLHERLGPWMESSWWSTVENFIQSNGSWSIALGALSPIPLQFWVIVPALARMPAAELFLALLIGRLVRFVALCWIASHAPKLLSRSKGIVEELKEAGTDPDEPKT
jgi:membrane protein YqaA with SNARE-associated domain